MKSIPCILIAGLMLAGCDAVSTLSDGLKQSTAVAAELEKSVGSKPFVGFNWNNGRLDNVNITFKGIPQDKSTQEIAVLSQASIKRHFKEEPCQVVISFSIEAK